MANRGRATFAKRQKEIARQERAREKAAKRVDRKEHKVKLDRNGVEIDPDIADIVPGPQPLPYDLLDEETETKT
jgi:cell division protein FtsB